MCRRRLYVVRCHIPFRLVLGTTRLSIVEAGLGPKCNGIPIDGTAYDTRPPDIVGFNMVMSMTKMSHLGKRLCG